MKQEYLILLKAENSVGTARIDEEKNVEISLSEEIHIEKDCVFKAYFVDTENKTKEYLGVLDGYKGVFSYNNKFPKGGIVICIKNVSAGKEEYFCHGAREGNLKGVLECFMEKNNAEKNNAKEKTVNYEKEYVAALFKNISTIMKGYTYEKINGYYLREKERILEYIMSGEKVKKRVSEKGFYILAKKETEGGKEYIVAIPSEKEDGCPFENCEKYGYTADGEIGEEMQYWCIEAGRDAEGEYFKKIK